MLDGALDDVDGAIDAGAETARIGEQDFHVPLLPLALGRRSRSASRSESRITQAAPMVMAESATLNAGKVRIAPVHCTKSTTWPSSQPVDDVADGAAEDQREARRQQRLRREREPAQPEHQRDRDADGQHREHPALPAARVREEAERGAGVVACGRC